MFGKGVYFADMVSKSGKLHFPLQSAGYINSFIDDSANYCQITREAPEGLMLLCEVALGKMYECYKSTNLSGDTLPNGTHSAKGCGQTAPDSKSKRTNELFANAYITFLYLRSLFH